MRPRRTHNSTNVYRLVGGNEDNDLWVQRAHDSQGNEVICSVWVPTDEERKLIAEGHNIELVVWGGQPPVAMHLDDTPLGKAPGDPE